MRINLRVSIALATAVLVLFAVGTPSTSGQDVPAGTSSGRTSRTTSKRAQRGIFVKAQKVVILYAEVDGLIVDIASRPQDFVKAGDAVITLDDRMTQLDRQSIDAKLEINAITSEQNKIRHEYSVESLKVVRKTYNTIIGDTRAATEKELKEAEQMADIARLQLRADVQERGLLELNLKQYAQLLGRYKVKSPVSGVLVPFASVDSLRERKLKQPEVGEWVRAGQVVAAVIKVDHLRVAKTVPVAQLDQVQVGQKAKVFLGKSSEPVQATVVFKGPKISTTDKFNIEVEFVNPEIAPKVSDRSTYRYRYRPGMRARVELLSQE
jgi:multidrug efflux pump subunit AcrA (membrane-fusion protein)